MDYKLSVGDKAPGFELKDINEEMKSLSDYEGVKVVFFTCNHCPYARAYDDRVNNLVENYPNVSFIGINSNDAQNYPEDSFEEMKKRTDVKFDYLHDPSQEVAKSFGGVCTPHFFLFDENNKLKYQGRLDDSWKEESKVSREDLKEAIEQVLKGQEVSVKETSTIGCSIKWKQN